MNIKYFSKMKILALSFLFIIEFGYIGCGNDERIYTICYDNSDCGKGYFCYNQYCVSESDKKDEVCDGKDNDYDGEIDEHDNLFMPPCSH